MNEKKVICFLKEYLLLCEKHKLMIGHEPIGDSICSLGVEHKLDEDTKELVIKGLVEGTKEIYGTLK